MIIFQRVPITDRVKVNENVHSPKNNNFLRRQTVSLRRNDRSAYDIKVS